MKRIVPLLTLVLLIFSSIHAQEPPSWFPDPAAVFAENVTYQQVEPVDESPRLVVDNEQRLVSVYDPTAGNWTEYPFPDEVETFQRSVELLETSGLEGRWLLSTTMLGERADRPDPDGQWLLDPTTGMFSRSQPVCGVSPSDQRQWVISQDANGQLALCSTEDETLLPLSVDDMPQQPEFWQVLDLSPDERTLLVTAGYQVFSYDLTDQQVVNLGGYNGTLIDVVEWLDNTTFFAHVGETAEWSMKSLYIGSANEGDSLRSVMSSIRIYPTRFDDPPRYEFVPALFSSGSKSCALMLFYLDTLEQHSVDLGGGCEPTAYSIPVGPGGEYAPLFRVLPENSSTARLVDVDRVTRSITVLYEGEIEAIYAASPDRRYVPLILDADGDIDHLPLSLYGGWIQGGDIPGTLFVFATSEGTLIPIEDDNAPVFDAFSTATWITDTIFSLTYDEGEYYLVDVAGQRSMRLETGLPSAGSPDGGFIEIWEENRISLLDTETWETVPLINNRTEHTLTLEWVDDTTVTAAFSSQEPVTPPVVTFRVTVDQ